MYNTESVILMKEIILGSYDTFDEIPEGLLLVKENSNLMYIRIGSDVFIAREFIDTVLADNTNYSFILSYYNVKNNEKILTLEVKKDIEKDTTLMTSIKSNTNIIRLSKVLNIKNNKVIMLSLEDINNLIDFKEQYIKGEKHSII